jgi:hypothetical protein
MNLPQEIKVLIKILPEESQAVVKAIALIYETKFQEQALIIEDQGKRIKKLEDQIAKNSNHNQEIA